MSILLAHAQQLAEKALAKAAELHIDAAVVILDRGGRLVLAHRMDHASYIAVEVGRSKAEVALGFQAPTHVLAQLAQDSPEVREAVRLAFDKATLLPGGFPILAEGMVIGGLGISGGTDALHDIAIGEAALA